MFSVNVNPLHHDDSEADLSGDRFLAKSRNHPQVSLVYKKIRQSFGLESSLPRAGEI